MLDPTDYEDEIAAIQAAQEYARRSRKNIPSDRWATGVVGAKLVARGIEAMQKQIEFQDNLIADLTAVTKTMWTDIQDHMNQSKAACEPSADPMRND